MEKPALPRALLVVIWLPPERTTVALVSLKMPPPSPRPYVPPPSPIARFPVTIVLTSVTVEPTLLKMPPPRPVGPPAPANPMELPAAHDIVGKRQGAAVEDVAAFVALSAVGRGIALGDGQTGDAYRRKVRGDVEDAERVLPSMVRLPEPGPLMVMLAEISSSPCVSVMVGVPAGRLKVIVLFGSRSALLMT